MEQMSSQIDDAANTNHEVARGDRNGGADYLFDDGGIGGHAAGDRGDASHRQETRRKERAARVLSRLHVWVACIAMAPP